MTFADFALTEARFRKHFRNSPRDTWNENMVVLEEFLELDEAEREGKFPYIWAVDRKQHLTRVLVSKTMVHSCEERRDFWIMLKAIAGVKAEKTAPIEDMESKVRAEVVGRIAKGLMKLAGENGAGIMDLALEDNKTEPTKSAEPAAQGDYMAPWLETDFCTSCDECIKINPNIFAYNNDKKAYIKDANGGPYSDLVKAAEKCTAGVIHPGLPADKDGAEMEKWIKRGEKFN